MLGDKYQFLINAYGTGLVEAKPANDKLEWTYEKEGEEVFYRKRISTELDFFDESGNQISDFTSLYTLERNPLTRCNKVDLIVNKRCDKNGAWTQVYNGYLALLDGNWNVSRCHVTIKPRPYDVYTCLYDNWEKPINILNFNLDRYSARSTIGVIEYKHCSRTTFAFPSVPAYADMSPCITQSEIGQQGLGWTLVKLDIEIDVRVDTTWAREVFIGAQPGPDWKDDGGKWVRPVVPVEDPLGEVNNGQFYKKYWKIVHYTVTNGLKFKEVFEEIILSFFSCQYRVVSNFFDINKDGTNPNNRPYSKAFDHLKDLYLFALSDIKRAKDKDENASLLNVTLKKILNNLRVLFNVYWMIEEDTKILRLEHISYFQYKRMLDLTQDKYKFDIKGKWKYNYVKENLPVQENFKFKQQTTSYFDGLSIYYDVACSNDDSKFNETTYTADFTLTSIDDIVEYPAKYDGDEAMVLVQISPQGYIVSGNTLGNSNPQRNGNLSWPTLQDWYHRHNRPQKTGIMNGQPTNFDTFKRTRKQVPIKIQLCCTDFENFDPLDLVKTQLGWGEISQAKYIEPDELLTLETLHD